MQRLKLDLFPANALEPIPGQSLKVRGSANPPSPPRPHKIRSQPSTYTRERKARTCAYSHRQNMSLIHESKYPFEARAPETNLFPKVGLFKMSISHNIYDSQTTSHEYKLCVFLPTFGKLPFWKQIHAYTHKLNQLSRHLKLIPQLSTFEHDNAIIRHEATVQSVTIPFLPSSLPH